MLLMRVYTAMADGVDNDNYKLARNYSINYRIHKADPEYKVPADLIAGYGQTLANVKLPAGYSWEDEADTLVGELGNNVFSVKYTP